MVPSLRTTLTVYFVVRFLTSRHRLFVALLAVALPAVLIGCGGSEEVASDRSPIRVAAVDVQGEPLVFEDLGETDTVLWFWAPW